MADSLSTPTAYLVYLVFVATLGPLQFGYHLGELNAPHDVITCRAYEVPEPYDAAVASLPLCIPMEPGQWGFVQSIFTIGGLVGALVSGALADTYGRLFTMRAITSALFLGPIAEALAPEFQRSASAALFLERGLFGAFTQVMINAGILIAQLLGYFLSRDSLWRIILASAGLIAIFNYAGLLFAPESPLWLAQNQQNQCACLLGHDRPPGIQEWSDATGGEQQALLSQSRDLAAPQEPVVSFLDVILNEKYRNGVVAATVTMMAQQLCGINSVVMYSVSILGAIMPSAAPLITVLVSMINVLVTAACAPLADRIGRKPCLLLSTAGMGFNAMLLAIGLSKDMPKLSTFATLCFVCSFGVGLGPVPFILASELVPPEAVGAASSWALASNWFSTFCVAQFFPLINAALPRGQMYWIFTLIAVCFGTLIASLVPESNGKANADEVWGRGSATAT